jgi:ribosomal protein L37AE/L43A
MPIFYYRCPECETMKSRLLKGPAEAESEVFLCAKCSHPMVRAPKAPTTRITETLDNGIMVRKLERIADAEQIHDEMARGKKGTI